MAEFKLEWVMELEKAGKKFDKTKIPYFRLFQRDWDNWWVNSIPNCLYPLKNIFTQDVGYMKIKEEHYIKDINYLNVQMVMPAIKFDYEYSIWWPTTTIESLKRYNPSVNANLK